MNNRFESILKKVEKPARYIGEEKNIIIKDFEKTKVRFAFCFPDLYEVGMSHLGMQIIYYLTNNHEDFLCERVFAPWIDMEKEMRKNKMLLFSLENKRALNEFDIVGFTLQYEMSYTNILNMLELGGIELLAKDRGDESPLVIAGGPCAYNPEPMAKFVDLFIIGEGEEVNIELFELYRDHKETGFRKEDFLKDASKIQGIYVPSFYQPIYEGNDLKGWNKKYKFLPDKIIKRYISNLDRTFSLTKLIVPYIETVHKRSVVEIFRGCTQGCRFCEAGYIYRPVRERSKEKIKALIESQVNSTGYNEVSLSSLSSCDYSNLEELVDFIIDDNKMDKVQISLPSLRVDSLSVEILKKLEKLKRTGLTLAPEAGSQKMRDVINKNVTEDDYRNALKDAFDSGWSKIKLYYMLGLPQEDEKDLEAIKIMGDIGSRIFFTRPKEDIRGNFQLTTSVSCFVPKPFTPFQWEKQNTVEEFYKKIYYIKDMIKDRKIKFQYHDPRLSVLEGFVSRGDRKVSDAILKAFKKGAKFDGWSDQFKYDIWLEAINESGLSMENYNLREWSLDEVLPWDIIDANVRKNYLVKELNKSKNIELTGDCRIECNFCGIKKCEMRENFGNI